MKRLALVAAAAVLLAQSAPRPAGLRAPADFADIADKRARSVALFQEMGKVVTHPRCMNCHPRTDRPTQGDDHHPHSPPVLRGPEGKGVAGLECATCHGPRNVAFTNSGGGIPGDPHWQLAPLSMAWQGKSLGAICAQLKDRRRNGGKSLAQIAAHNAGDHLVGWGWRPGPDRAPAPGSQVRFGELTRAWIATGAACPKS